MSGDESADIDGFEVVVDRLLPQVSRGLVAMYGVEVGGEAAADAARWAWENRERLAGMANPAGFLFRVGQSSARRYLRWRQPIVLPSETVAIESTLAVDLADALKRLRPHERTAVLLVHGYGWSYEDAAQLLDLPLSSIKNHLARGRERLRRLLKEEQ